MPARRSRLDDGYVGSAVNIAARLCAQAGPGEVIVSETVRALTRTVLPVTFKPRGRRQLKGISEPIEVFAVVPAGPGIDAWAEDGRRRGSRGGRRAILAVGVGRRDRRDRRRRLGAARATGLPAGEWTIGVDMPLSGGFAGGGVAVRNAVQLAIDEANEEGVADGVQLFWEPYDHAGVTEEERSRSRARRRQRDGDGG